MPAQLYKVYSRTVSQFLGKVLELYALDEGQADIGADYHHVLYWQQGRVLQTHLILRQNATSSKEMLLSSWPPSGPPCVQKELLSVTPSAQRLAHTSSTHSRGRELPSSPTTHNTNLRGRFVSAVFCTVRSPERKQQWTSQKHPHYSSNIPPSKVYEKAQELKSNQTFRTSRSMCKGIAPSSVPGIQWLNTTKLL